MYYYCSIYDFIDVTIILLFWILSKECLYGRCVCRLLNSNLYAQTHYKLFIGSSNNSQEKELKS